MNGLKKWNCIYLLKLTICLKLLIESKQITKYSPNQVQYHQIHLNLKLMDVQNKEYRK